MTWHLKYLARFICSQIDKSSVLGFTIGARETERNKECSVALTGSLAQETTRGWNMSNKVNWTNECLSDLYCSLLPVDCKLRMSQSWATRPASQRWKMGDQRHSSVMEHLHLTKKRRAKHQVDNIAVPTDLPAIKSDDICSAALRSRGTKMPATPSPGRFCCMVPLMSATHQGPAPHYQFVISVSINGFQN